MNLFGFLRLNLFYMASPWHRRPYNTIWTYLQKVMSTRQALAHISNFKNVYTFLTATNKTPFNALHCCLVFFPSSLVWVPFLANVWLNAYLNGWHWLNGVTKWSRSRVDWNNFRANGAKLTTTTRKYDEQLSSKLLHMCAHELVLFDTIRRTREIN